MKYFYILSSILLMFILLLPPRCFVPFRCQFVAANNRFEETQTTVSTSISIKIRRWLPVAICLLSAWAAIDSPIFYMELATSQRHWAHFSGRIETMSHGRFARNSFKLCTRSLLQMNCAKERKHTDIHFHIQLRRESCSLCGKDCTNKLIEKSQRNLFKAIFGFSIKEIFARNAFYVQYNWTMTLVRLCSVIFIFSIAFYHANSLVSATMISHYTQGLSTFSELQITLVKPNIEYFKSLCVNIADNWLIFCVQCPLDHQYVVVVCIEMKIDKDRQRIE